MKLFAAFLFAVATTAMVTPRLKTLAFSGTLLQTAFALGLPECRGFKTAQNGSVLEVTLHNPDSATNLRGVDFQHGMADIVRRLRNDTKTKVIVFKSNIPQFFCAHLDLLIPSIESVGLKFARLMFDISDLPQVTIGAVEGRACGTGKEFLMALDMCFALKSESLFGQIEVGTGLIPSGGGSQHLPRLVGRRLAAEYLLSGYDINAKKAERIDWINRLFARLRRCMTMLTGLPRVCVSFPGGNDCHKEGGKHCDSPVFGGSAARCCVFHRSLE
ncbi:hypothetical protein FOBRF1_006958 [Fusarium oxysporum]